MKNTFLKSTFILILSGMATKVLGLIIKIIFTRIVGTTTISLYTIVMPTYSLLLTITTFAMPNTISKIVAEENNPKVLKTAFYIIIILNFLIILLMFISAPFIANTLLKEPKTYYLLIAMSFTLPFASLACILKGYFYGKQKMHPHVVSNVTEQLIRLLIVITIIPKLIEISYVHAAAGLILTSFFTELASIIVFLLFMDKKDLLNIKKLKYNTLDAKNIFSLSIPSVSSHIIGNICYFFEPIILTNILLYLGYSGSYILTEYGAYNAYSISTLTIPSFFITAISMALIPEIAKYYKQNNYNKMKKRLKESFIFTLIIGFSFSLVIYIFRYPILNFLYNTSLGANYIKLLAPIFILFYFEGIFNAFLQAVGKPHITLRITLICSTIKLLTIFILAFFKIGIYCLVFSEIINILLVVLLDYIYVRKFLNNLF